MSGTPRTMKNAETTMTTAPCFECEDGTLRAVIEDYKTTLPEVGKIVVPNVPMERCDECGDTVIGEEGNKIIDADLREFCMSAAETLC